VLFPNLRVVLLLLRLRSLSLVRRFCTLPFPLAFLLRKSSPVPFPHCCSFYFDPVFNSYPVFPAFSFFFRSCDFDQILVLHRERDFSVGFQFSASRDVRWRDFIWSRFVVSEILLPSPQGFCVPEVMSRPPFRVFGIYSSLELERAQVFKLPPCYLTSYKILSVPMPPSREPPLS